jgi:hypothetical protein
VLGSPALADIGRHALQLVDPYAVIVRFRHGR